MPWWMHNALEVFQETVSKITCGIKSFEKCQVLRNDLNSHNPTLTKVFIKISLHSLKLT